MRMPLRPLALGLAAAWALLVPWETGLLRATEILVLALLGLSMTVTTGWLRTLALHAPAAAAAGALLAGRVLGAGQSPLLAALAGAIAGALAAVVPVLPIARRHRDLVPAVTLGATVLVSAVLVPSLQPAPFPRPVLLGIDLGGGRPLYLAALVLVGLVWTAVANLDGAPAGRAARAIGADASYAGIVGVPVVATWLGMFALSGAAAGLAGTVLALQTQGMPAAALTTTATAVVALGVALLGGVTSPGGAVAGALAVGLVALALPARVEAQLVVAGAAVVLAVAVPALRGGLAGAGRRLADRLAEVR
jgi:ABC-type branched-subunit amino acid transport system permease subunit